MAGRPFVDLTGFRFGRWTVLHRSEIANRHPHWHCRCDCGKEKPVRADILKSGFSTCCLECSHKAKLKEGTGIRNMYIAYKSGAARRNFEFNLTFEQFETLVCQDCAYCGVEPSLRNQGKVVWICNGIDRVDNSKGYTLDNCVTACAICNQAKGTLTLEEFSDWLGRLTQYRTKLKLDGFLEDPSR